jgi:hypothetical protein
MSKPEQIWFKDPLGYIMDMDSILDFIPDGKSSIEAQMNDAFRFSLYFGIVIAILRSDIRALFFPAFVAFFTIFIYNHELQNKQSKSKLLEKLNVDQNSKTKEMCLKPTQENPFMNVLISDYKDFPNRPQACKATQRVARQDIKKFVNDTVPKNVEAVYDRTLSDVQFHTMPSTTIPNQQSEFANWLYNPGQTVKESGVLSFDWRR